jgi:hypothetical protein
VNEREVLAFDLYGTLGDPIAIAAGPGQLLGDVDGREAAAKCSCTYRDRRPSLRRLSAAVSCYLVVKDAASPGDDQRGLIMAG